MSALDRKLWRDLWQMKSQALAIALVVMCGVGTYIYIMFLATLGALRATQDSYYREYRFAEVFATLKRAPEALRQRVQVIAGINAGEQVIVHPDDRVREGVSVAAR